MSQLSRREPAVQIVIGLAIAIMGVLFTLDNLHILRARAVLRFWPIAFVAIGVTQIANAKTPTRVWGGIIWVVVGTVMLLDRAGLLYVNIWALWPLVLVLVGGRIFLHAMNPAETRGEVSPTPPGANLPIIDAKPGETNWIPESNPTATATPAPTTSAVAVMGGFNRKVVSSVFERAELTAFMGGGKLDLREAALANGHGVVDIFALMGGFEILVPETWNVDVRVTPFMGGCDDRTIRHPDGTAPRLTIRGFVMMGGIDVRNRPKGAVS
jgi:predicted membrane protein